MLSPEKNADLSLKHLEMIQSIVLRMGNYSASVKNFCITITIALLGFSVTRNSTWLVLTSFVPVIVFGLVDAQYLRLERRFRCLYDDVRKRDLTVTPNFALDLSSVPRISLWKVISSWSIASFYGSLIVGLLVVLIIRKLQ